MIENQCVLKKERADYQPSRDTISELPLSIIHDILALVPIRDAVKTSILSRQWRYTWASLPQLKVEEHCPLQDYVNSRPEFDDRMKNFITHVLLLHKGPIHKFKLSVSFTRNCQNIGFWLLCLSRNDIRELIIDMPKPHWSQPCWTQELHSSIYSCQMLTKLEISYCKLDPSPTTFKAFSFLRCLFLREADLSINEVESLVANCPLLEDFTLIECESSELRISAPNLKVLHLRGVYSDLSVCASLLAELSVKLEVTICGYDYIRHDNSVCNYANFMGGLTNLEKLHGDYGFTKYLSMGIETCQHTLVFHQLKDIKLSDMQFDDINDVSVVARLIVGAPNLEKLKIKNLCYIYKDEYASEDPYEYLGDFGCAPNVKLEKLRTVHMIHVTGLHYETALIKFLLERSPVLETMSFSELTLVEKQCLSARLQGCSRASPNAELSLHLEAERY